MVHRCSLYSQLFTISTVSFSLYAVLGVFLADPRSSPELYPPFYWPFHGCLYSLMVVLASWSYIRAWRTRSYSKGCLIGVSTGKCSQCGISKPDRAHHCSICEKCVYRMDHHCVWVNNCIGFHNYKYFLLFVFYMSMGASLYDYHAVQYYFYGTSPDLPVSRPEVRVIVGIESVIVVLTTILTTSLWVMHLLLTFNNVTTIEFIQGKPVKCLGYMTDLNNYHNVGLVQNFLQVFGENPLTWLIPIAPHSSISGQFYPKVPAYSGITITSSSPSV